jgi:hypothetical protein
MHPLKRQRPPWATAGESEIPDKRLRLAAGFAFLVLTAVAIVLIVLAFKVFEKQESGRSLPSARLPAP